MHAFALKSSYTNDTFVTTAIVDVYFKHGLVDSARKLFDEIPTRDLVLFTAMVCGFSKNGLASEALDIFINMVEDGCKPSRVTIASVLSACAQTRRLDIGRTLHGYSIRSCLICDTDDIILESSLLHMYAKCGKLCLARQFFDRMQNKNLGSWESIISGFAFSGSFMAAFELFKEMIFDGYLHPRSSIISLLLNICGMTMDLRKGREIHAYLHKRNIQTSDLDRLIELNSVMNMYMKAGDLTSAVSLFKATPIKNVVTWTTLIFGFGSFGLSKEALRAYHEMEESGIMPDEVTFIALLSACSHSRLVDEGRELYISMQRDYGFVPTMRHFVCMVDLYARAGLLEDAFDFVKSMPVEASPVIWGTILSSCRIHKNLKVGEYAAKMVLEADRDGVGNYLLLSKLYADANSWEDFAKVRLVMKELDLNPRTACSWVELKGQVYTFTVNDSSKSFSKKVFKFLEELGGLMKEAGRVADTSCVSHNIGEDDKVRHLCGHTEKLALGFVLMEFQGQGVIRIGKNLRVCRDCHEVFKFVSKKYDREIILKDPNRYHRFSQGSCSCQDYW